jgi:hypothetical protein
VAAALVAVAAAAPDEIDTAGALLLSNSRFSLIAL